jgi:hypothetical protein
MYMTYTTLKGTVGYIENNPQNKVFSKMWETQSRLDTLSLGQTLGLGRVVPGLVVTYTRVWSVTPT